ncbi:hypothetical protein ABZZ20_28840 [Streptomyces sp. NPDC006430]|uniref:hypothetical protein n=1 Tax=Streptomyces sp. NPDC006430 TaxID=3154299 RepID=UPI0033BB3FBE
MDQRTRERLPVLPALVKSASDELKKAQARLAAVHAAAPGASFTVLGATYIKVKGTRYIVRTASATVYDAAGRRRCLGVAEQHAFWAWATVEFLRHTGGRIEEMRTFRRSSATPRWPPVSPSPSSAPAPSSAARPLPFPSLDAARNARSHRSCSLNYGRGQAM